MKKHARRLIVVVIAVAAIGLLAACTSVQSTGDAVGSGLKVGPLMFQLPALKPGEVKSTPADPPMLKQVKDEVKGIESAVAPVIVPVEEAQVAPQTRATDQKEYWAGAACSLGH